MKGMHKRLGPSTTDHVRRSKNPLNLKPRKTSDPMGYGSERLEIDDEKLPFCAIVSIRSPEFRSRRSRAASMRLSGKKCSNFAISSSFTKSSSSGVRMVQTEEKCGILASIVSYAKQGGLKHVVLRFVHVECCSVLDRKF